MEAGQRDRPAALGGRRAGWRFHRGGNRIWHDNAWASHGGVPRRTRTNRQCIEMRWLIAGLPLGYDSVAITPMSALRRIFTRWRLAVIPLACVVAGCARVPDSMAMPAQFTMPSGPEPAVNSLPYMRPLLSMADADIDDHIIRDVLRANTGEPSRWTQEHPAFRLIVDEVEGLEFYVQFFIPESTFQVTGPVKLTIGINGATVATPEFRNDGGHEFQCAIPAGLLKRREPATISLDVSPPYRAPKDGTKLGVLLFATGFRKRSW